MSGAEISIVMGVYNQRAFNQLEQAVDSILKQSFQNFEYLIYNDGSDGEVTEQLQNIASRDLRIRLFCAKRNHGLAYALNYCIKHSSGKYIARMDADDISMPERLQRQYDFLEEHEEYGFVGCNARLLRESGVCGLRLMPERPKAENFLAFSPYIHPAVMFRREVFEKYGLYSESKNNLRCEDYELFMRFYQKGCIGYNIQEPLFLYREDENTFKKRKYRYRVDEFRLRYTYFKKLGLLNAKSTYWVVKPLIAGLVPGKLLYELKKRENRHGISVADK